MKTKYFIISFIAALVFPAGVFALSAPTADAVPSTINADTYTLKIHTEKGAKVTVVGGPSDLAPVTDGESGDALDGIVRVMVGLAQNAENVFSIVAQKGTDISDSIIVTIHESDAGAASRKDSTPPPAPVLDSIPATVYTETYEIKGVAEANANIYIKKTDGTSAGSGRANSNGIFLVKVTLEAGKTNRFNVTAEDAAYNVGPATQAVIPAAETLMKGEEPFAKGVSKSTVTTTAFKDVTGHWSEQYIDELYSKKIVSGKSADSFDPNGKITRAELTKIAMNAFEFEVPASVTAKPFTDVETTAWYAPYIQVAKDAGVIGGYEDGSFKPEEFINRAAALKILLKAAAVEIGTGETAFKDVAKTAWFAPYVAYAFDNQVVAGYADGAFRPNNPITRAEVAKIVVKIMELK